MYNSIRAQRECVGTYVTSRNFHCSPITQILVDPRLIANDLIAKFPKHNPHSKPKLTSVTIGTVNAEATTSRKNLLPIFNALTQITGQMPTLVNARKPVAQFKTRAGMPLGTKVTLRKDKAENFYAKLLVNVFPNMENAVARSPGKKTDQHGSLFFGIPDLNIFPELRGSANPVKGGCHVQFNTKLDIPKDQNTFMLSCYLLPIAVHTKKKKTGSLVSYKSNLALQKVIRAARFAAAKAAPAAITE